MARDISAEILEGLAEATAYMQGDPGSTRTAVINVPEHIDVREVREALGATQIEFAARFAIPVDTLRKWERGTREPDAAGKAYLLLIKRNPKAVEEILRAA